jgi:hypothetical protein
MNNQLIETRFYNSPKGHTYQVNFYPRNHFEIIDPVDGTHNESDLHWMNYYHPEVMNDLVTEPLHTTSRDIFDNQANDITTYTLEHKLCEADPASEVPEAIWSAVFSFNATDEQDATRKATGWARYHSFDRNDVRIRPATQHEATHWMHNEYVD